MNRPTGSAALLAATRAAAATAAALAVHAAVNAALLRRPPAAPEPPAELVSVCVPARDEAARIGACLRALRAQPGVPLEILVLDDGSTDATAEVVRAASGEDPRVRLLSGRPLPPGWLGKPHACAQLAAAAAGSVLVFVDADVRLAPDGLARTVALLRGEDLQLVSPYPRQECAGVGPRLVQPLLQWSWLTFLPLRLAERLPAPSLVAANGQLLACDAAAYRSVGGHGTVRGDVVEDLALARAFKAAGLRATVSDGTAVASCRMYPDWGALVDGYAKSLWAGFGSARGAAGVLGLLSWLYLLPPVAALLGAATGRRDLAGAGLTGTAAGIAGRVVSALRTGGRPADATGHPASIALLLWLTVRSLRARRAGTLTWRGRPVG